ncbi:MAG: hypothetical protein VR69_03525 [Peptococcaceae bacterium BRH_c4b]|nr:MAG: hypothetical protein VR69_03525 [Peptococcaceae bacterium BRH_c4b]
MLNDNRFIQKLVDNLFVLLKVMRQGAESDATKGGFTIPQKIVMGQLVRHGDLSVKELSQKVGLAHSTVSGIVDRLERKGLAMRIYDPQDRRITKVIITDLAREHFNNRLPHRMFSGIVDAFQKATTEEQIKILDGLTILRQLLDKGE